MKCPTDGSTLVMSERSGIEIDYCPECRGVWLDRGELDKIVERAAADSVPGPAAAPTPRDYRESDYREPSYRDDRSYGGRPYKKKKREHWLMEIFD